MLLRSGYCSRITKNWLSGKSPAPAQKGLRSSTQYPVSPSRFQENKRPSRFSKKESRRSSGPIFPKADVLILDGTNISFWASSDWKRWSHLGATLEGSFKDQLDFLTAALGYPQERFVVFDKRKSEGHILQRRLVNPRYLEKRHLRLGLIKAEPPGVVAGALQILWKDFKIAWLGQKPQQRPRHRLWDASWAAGYEVVEAQGGWEGDDAIAALCTLVKERPGAPKKVAVVSNDSDLLQLLDEHTTVTRAPAWHASASSAFKALDEMTVKTFTARYGFSPEIFPLFLALKGKKDSGVPGISTLSAKSLVRLCAKVSASDLDALEEGRPLSPDLVANRDASIQDAFSHGPNSRLEQVQRNLFQTRLSREVHSLPEGFRLQSSQEVEQAAARQAQGSILDRMRSFFGSLLPRRPSSSAQEASDSAELPEFADSEGMGKPSPPTLQATLPTLIWMMPFNRGRARYLRPHVEALSAFLRSLRIAHRSWAVSADGLPIDLAVTDDSGAAIWHGLNNSSVFVILGPGDYQKPEEPIPPSLSLEGKSKMEQILHPPPRLRTMAVLNEAAKLRIKELKRAGWMIHVVHHRLLESVLGYKPPKAKF